MTCKVGVVGLWHQGIVGAAVLADWGHIVTGSDRDSEKIRLLNRGESPIFEPGLDDIILRSISEERLNFTSKLGDAVRKKSHVLIMHDIPVDENDISDLTDFFEDIREIIPSLESGVAILVTAQISVGTCRRISELISQLRPEINFTLAYFPENLRLGTAIERFRSPPLPVLGVDKPGDHLYFIELFVNANVKWEICSIETAEMLKHALNGFLALSVSFINEVGNLCDQVGANGHRIGELLKLDSRIGRGALTKPGLAFSGGTLARDIQTMRSLGDKYSIDTFCIDGVWESNLIQQKIVLRTLIEVLGTSFRSLQIGILGLTYKANTSTVRRSASIDLITDICARGGSVKVNDPKAAESDLEPMQQVQFEKNAIDVASGSDVLILMTPWDVYKDFDFVEAQSVMRRKLVFDTANIWDGSVLRELGFEYLTVGNRGEEAR